MFGLVSLFYIYLLNFSFSYIFHYAKNSVRICFPIMTAQNEFQILNLHHKKTCISKIKVPVFLMPIAKVKKKFPPNFLSYKNS